MTASTPAVTQRIGLTDVTISYSRPLVKGRKMFGGLVPYGEVWRAGANENTIIEFSDPVTIEGQPVAKGTYGLHMIPGENEWTVILSKNSSSWGSFTYDQKEDALRVKVKPQASEAHETLAYRLRRGDARFRRGHAALGPRGGAVQDRGQSEGDRAGQDQVAVARRWRNTPGKVGTRLPTQLLTYKTDLPEALEYADHSIQVEKRFENLMTKANVLEAMDRKNEAAPFAPSARHGQCHAD